MPQPYLGGSFAPPLTDHCLPRYKALAEALDARDPIRDAMLKLHACVLHWWGLPESGGPARSHQSGVGAVVPLDREFQDALWEHIPWGHELDAMAALFEGIDPVRQKPLRDAAHHLLWHVKELDLDREPATTDVLPAHLKPKPKE